MNLKFIKSFNDYRNKKKLKTLYPEANAFFRLFELFPDTYTKESPLGNTLVPMRVFCQRPLPIERVFEKKEANGTMNTCVLPIKYNSLYSFGICNEVIRDAFEKYPEFFKTFLRDYKRVVVNDEGPYEDLDFVIDDYNENLSIDGYELYYLIHKVLEKYDVSEELAYSIAVRLEELRNNTPSDNLINYHKLVFEQKLSRNQLINYYVRNGKFEELKFVLDNPCQTTLVRDRFFMSEALPFLNNVLGVGIFSSMVETNPTVCRDAIDSYVETVRKGYLFGRERSFIGFDRFDSIKLAKLALSELDPTGKLSNYFNNTLKDGKVLTFEADGKTGFIYEFFKEDEDGNIVVVEDKKLEDATDFIHMPCSDSIVDVVDLVSSVVRSYISKKRNSEFDDEECFEEVIANYYETRCFDFLIKNGFDEEEITRCMNAKRAGLFNYRDLDYTQNIIGLLAKKSEYGEITYDMVSDSNEASEIYNDAYNVAKNVYFSRGHLDNELISCALGCHLGDTYKSSNFSENMMWAIEKYCNGFNDNNHLFNKLISSTYSDEVLGDDIEVDPSVLFREDFKMFPGHTTEIKPFDWDNFDKKGQFVKLNHIPKK